MARYSVKISGLNDIKKSLNSKRIIEEIDDEMMIYAEEIRSKSVNYAPHNTGLLAAGIENRKEKVLVYDVVVNAEYGPFVEFGTKTKVQVDPVMQDLANKFRGAKISQTDFKESIQQWMRQKGIDLKFTYPIIAKIMGVGINPQPFLTPAYKETISKIEAEFDAKIKKIVNRK